MLHENDIESFFGNLGEPEVGMPSCGLASEPPSVASMVLSREREIQRESSYPRKKTGPRPEELSELDRFTTTL